MAIGTTYASILVTASNTADANARIRLTARTIGSAGNGITFRLANGTEGVVTVTGKAIEVARGTGLDYTLTANELKTAIEANSLANALISCTVDANGNGNTNVRKPTATTTLSGGTDIYDPPHGVFHGGDANSGEALKFMWFSDSHYCVKADMGDDATGRFYRQGLIKISAMIADANSAGVNLIIGTGDISDISFPPPYKTLLNNAAVTGLFDACGLDYYLAVGNHDYVMSTKAKWLTQMGYAHGYYSFTKNGYHFIILDAMFDANGNDITSLTGAGPYYIPAAERTWLAADLKANKGRPCLVFTHQRINSYFCGWGDVEAADGAVVRAILEAAGNVKAVFQGHTHFSSYDSVGGIPYYNIEGMVDGNTIADSNYDAYALVSIDTNGLLTITPYKRADAPLAWKGHATISDVTGLSNAWDYTSVHTTTGKIDSALAFNGTSDYVDTDQTFESAFQNSFMISLWCKPNDGQPSGNQNIFAAATAPLNEVTLKLLPSGALLFSYIANGRGDSITSEVVFNDNQEKWHLVTVAMNGGVACIYFDGALKGSKELCTAVEMSDFTNSNSVLIGQYDNNNYYCGSLDDVRIYCYTPSQEEIAEIYNGAGIPYICTSPIISDLDENCQVDFLDYAIFANEWKEDTLDLADMAEFALDWLTCNRDPVEECWQ